MQDVFRSKANRQHGEIVALRRLTGKAMGGLAHRRNQILQRRVFPLHKSLQHFDDATAAEGLAFLVLGFRKSVRIQEQGGSRRQHQGLVFIRRIGENAQGQIGFRGQQRDILR